MSAGSRVPNRDAAFRPVRRRGSVPRWVRCPTNGPKYASRRRLRTRTRTGPRIVERTSHVRPCPAEWHVSSSAGGSSLHSNGGVVCSRTIRTPTYGHGSRVVRSCAVTLRRSPAQARYTVAQGISSNPMEVGATATTSILSAISMYHLGPQNYSPQQGVTRRSARPRRGQPGPPRRRCSGNLPVPGWRLHRTRRARVGGPGRRIGP